MNCFNHQNQTAIGLCAGCYKGVCTDCCAYEKQLTCNNEACIQYSNKHHHIVSTANLENGNQVIKRSYLTNLIMSLFFIVLGTFFFEYSTLLTCSFIGIGAFLFIYNFYNLITKNYLLYRIK